MGLLKKNGNEEDFSDDLLRGVDEDGAEYFTVKATGQSGMSHGGIARFVGKRQQMISKLVARVRRANPTLNSLPKCLKPFAGHDLTLTSYFDAEGRDILEDGFCATIVEYYAKWAKSRKPGSNDKAKRSLDLIQHLGMRVFIHHKTGWKPGTVPPKSDSFEQEFDAHKERYSVRQILRFEDDPELKAAIGDYMKKHHLSQKIFSDTYDEMNKLLQGLKSIEIKTSNNLSKSALIRDYYEASPLINYITITRGATNQIRGLDVHPVKAVQTVFALLYPMYVPKPLPIIENVYKADKRLRTEAKRRRLTAGIQLSLNFSTDAQDTETQAS